jgi:hypothetical protein
MDTGIQILEAVEPELLGDGDDWFEPLVVTGTGVEGVDAVVAGAIDVVANVEAGRVNGHPVDKQQHMRTALSSDAEQRLL